MRAPVTYVVLRHRMTHPDDGPADIARHCHLHDASVRAAVRRIERQNIWREEDVLFQLRSLSEQPPTKRLYFTVPNPERFLATLQIPHWISGEFAAAAEGFDLVPERLFLYVRANELEAAVKTVFDHYGKVATHAKANLLIALPDAWMYLDPTSDFIERGQRLIDYSQSRHLQILRGLQHG